MKKLLLALVMAFTAMAGHAQVTFNIRAGGGGFQTDGYSTEYSYYDGDYISEFIPAASFILELNVSPRGKKFVFSPSILVASDFDCATTVEFPLHVGYKVPMGNRSLFIPKVGPMFGADTYSYTSIFMCGLSAELAFEIKHFIAAINLREDFMNMGFGVFGTIGVKF